MKCRSRTPFLKRGGVLLFAASNVWWLDHDKEEYLRHQSGVNMNGWIDWGINKASWESTQSLLHDWKEEISIYGIVFLKGGKNMWNNGERASNLKPAKDEVMSYEKEKGSGHTERVNCICLTGVIMRPRTGPSSRGQSRERAKRYIFLCSIPVPCPTGGS